MTIENTLIIVKPKKNFDRWDLYPVNELAQQFAALLNKPNLPLDAIHKLRAMGYIIEEKHDSVI